MHTRAIRIIAAGIWAMALSAQTAPAPFQVPHRFPGVPQFTVTPREPLVPRQLLKNDPPEKTVVCSIPPLEVPLPNNVEQMPVLRPLAENIDNMPVMVPAPPCQKETP
jgi:hypothetical protein